MKIDSRLTKYFYHKYNIDPNTEFKIEKVKAKKLIVFNRIDLIAKMKYIEFREKGFDMKFAKELYKKHIEAFSLGTFSEPGDESKDSINKYFIEFDNMIDQMKENGFDDNISVIPVGANNTIIDGAHRTAIAAYFDFEVSIVRFENIQINYGAEYFRKRLLDEKYLDYMVTEYCKQKENVYFACVWPKAKGENKFREMEFVINNATNIVYKKSVSLNYQGLRNLMIQIYSSDDWIGTIGNGFAGVSKKVDACFDSFKSIRCYVLECETLENILKMKSEIRNIFQIGNHSVHITDNQYESLQICNLLLNQNSVDFLNNGQPDYYKNFYFRITNLRDNLIRKNFSLEDVIITSNSILGLYGSREPMCINFMTLSNEFVIDDEKITKDHDSINFYQTTIDDLVLNPSNYLIYNDVKFITLDNLIKFKRNRDEKTDWEDIKLINSLQNNKRKFHSLLCVYTSIKRRVMRTLQSCKESVIIFLKKIRLYKKVKGIYSYLRSNKA